MSWQPEDDLEAPAPGQAPAARKIWVVVWEHKALVLLGAVVGLILSGVLYARATPVYQSSAQVMVIKNTSSPLPLQGVNPGVSLVDDYVSAHLVLLKSQYLVERAVRDHELQSLPSFANADPVGAVIAALGVARDENAGKGAGSNIINLSYRGTVPEDCQKVLRAVIKSYDDFLDEKYKKSNDDVLAMITTLRNKYEKELDDAKGEYYGYLDRYPFLQQSKDGTPLQYEKLRDVDRLRQKAAVELADLKNRIASIRKLRGEGKGAAAQLALVPARFKEGEKAVPVEMRMEEQLLPLLIEQEQLLEGFGESHPKVLAVSRKIDRVRDYYRRLLEASAPADGDAPAADGDLDAAARLAHYLDAMEREVSEYEQQAAALDEVFAGEDKAARAHLQVSIRERQLREAVEQKKEVFDGIVKRLQELNFSRDSGGYDAEQLSRPEIGYKVSPKLSQYLLLGLALGGAAGVGLGYLAELTDRGFRTPDEVRARLGLAVIGNVPVLQPDAGAKASQDAGEKVLDPYLVAHYRPKSVEAEAYRSVRTSLYFSTQGGGHSVIQVTSPNMGEGKSTLSTNLAVSIAQSGKRIVIVDADLRRPRLHKILNLPNHTGLASVIAGQASLEGAVQRTAVPNLSALTCGPLPPNPAELLTSPAFADVLGSLRGAFDFVLVDTPPVLVVTDPSAVAPRVDGVILTVRLSKKCGPPAERARGVLASLGVKVLGVVINGVGRGGAAGRYGHYSSYSYEAGYEYEPDEDGEAYYAAGEGEGTAPAPGA